MILDEGVLFAIDRGDAAARAMLTAASRNGVELHTTHPVLAQVWRTCPRQARLAQLLKAIVIHPFDDGRAVGQLLSASGTSDVVDAHLVIMATRLGVDVLTGDLDDISKLTEALGPAGPRVHSWP